MPPLSYSELKPGKKVVHENELFVITNYEHVKPGKGAAFVRTKMRRYSDGRILEFTFTDKDRVEEADFEQKTCQFLYEDQDGIHFMNLTTYEQFSVERDFLGVQANFLKPEAEVICAFHEERCVGIDLPPKMVFEVTDTIDDIARGNTANSVTKEATIETGWTLQVPPFIKTGEMIRVSTVDGTYVDRSTG